MATSNKTQRVLAVVLVGLVAAIAVVLVTGRASSGSHTPTGVVHKSSAFYGPSMPADLKAANFTLTDQAGRRVTLAAQHGHVVVLTFIHSLCKDACPFMTEQIKGALNLLPGHGAGVSTIGVSVEPGQDTVKHRDYFLRLHEMMNRMHFVNGPRAELRKVWSDYKIQPVHGKVDHSTFVLLIDKRGYERVGYAADELTPTHLAHDIRVLEREPA